MSDFIFHTFRKIHTVQLSTTILLSHENENINFSCRYDNVTKRVKFTPSTKLLLIPLERNSVETVYRYTTTEKNTICVGNDQY